MPVVGEAERKRRKRSSGWIWGSGFAFVLLVSTLAVPFVHGIDFALGGNQLSVWGSLTYNGGTGSMAGIPIPPGYGHRDRGPAFDFWTFRIGSCVLCVMRQDLPL